MAKFPENFMWGAATSSIQIEGVAPESGKGKNIWDEFSHIPGINGPSTVRKIFPTE